MEVEWKLESSWTNIVAFTTVLVPTRTLSRMVPRKRPTTSSPKDWWSSPSPNPLTARQTNTLSQIGIQEPTMSPTCSNNSNSRRLPINIIAMRRNSTMHTANSKMKTTKRQMSTTKTRVIPTTRTTWMVPMCKQLIHVSNSSNSKLFSLVFRVTITDSNNNTIKTSRTIKPSISTMRIKTSHMVNTATFQHYLEDNLMLTSFRTPTIKKKSALS
mmetsp:Transcript_29371/g.70635  ORF Transcript_29371/g.70635 Transcript_29371/m.70635 type:complete len:214 (-) Transcript_29371:1480-2121(-)